MKITITSEDQADRCRTALTVRSAKIIMMATDREMPDGLRLRSLKREAHELHQTVIALIIWENRG